MSTFAIAPVSVSQAESGDFPDYLQFQDEGVDLGQRDADTLNFTGTGVTATRGVGEDANVVTVEVEAYVPPATEVTWNSQAGEYTIQSSDANNGIATTGTSGSQTITIPADDQLPGVLDGASIVVYQEGPAGVDFAPVSGVNLNFRSVFVASIAGQFGTVSLIKRGSNNWILCGDMEAA